MDGAEALGPDAWPVQDPPVQVVVPTRSRFLRKEKTPRNQKANDGVIMEFEFFLVP